MTPKTLFIIILKVIGLLLLKDILAAIIQFFPLLTNSLQSESLEEILLLAVSAVVGLTVFAVVPYYFLFRTKWLIDKLQLDQGFEQEVLPLNMHRSTVLSVSVIVIGGLLIANELPNLSRQLLTYSQERRDGHLNPELSYLLLTAAKITVGIIIISKQQQLVNFIEYQRKR